MSSASSPVPSGPAHLRPTSRTTQQASLPASRRASLLTGAGRPPGGVRTGRPACLPAGEPERPAGGPLNCLAGLARERRQLHKGDKFSLASLTRLGVRSQQPPTLTSRPREFDALALEAAGKIARSCLSHLESEQSRRLVAHVMCVPLGPLASCALVGGVAKLAYHLATSLATLVVAYVRLVGLVQKLGDCGC